MIIHEASHSYKPIYMNKPNENDPKGRSRGQRNFHLTSGVMSFLLFGLCALAILMLGVRQQITDISSNPTNFFHQVKIAPQPLTGFTASSPDVMLAINGAKLEIDKEGVINSNTGNIVLHDGAMRFSDQAVIDTDLSVITINKFTNLNGGATIYGTTTIAGNLNVLGTTNYTSASITTIDDVNLLLAKNNNTDIVDIGITAQYNKGDGVRFDSLYRDHSTGNWTIRSQLQIQPTGVVTPTGSTGYATLEIGNFIAQGSLKAPGMGSVSGIAMAWNPITGTIGYVPSSRRFKKDIQYIQHGLGKTSGEILDETVAVHYRYRQGNQEAVGFIAEEVAKVFPQAVSVDKEGIPMSVDYMAYIPLLVDEIQKLRHALRRHGIPMMD